MSDTGLRCHGASQAEPHSSFTAQLANYTQAAMLMRRWPELLLDFRELFIVLLADCNVQSQGTFSCLSVGNAATITTPTQNARRS